MARNILDTIRSVADDAEDFENVLNLISRLADDREPSVRSELMEQVQPNSLQVPNELFSFTQGDPSGW